MALVPLAIILIFGGHMINALSDQQIVQDVNMTTQIQQVPSMFDNFFGILAFALFLLPIGTAFMVRTTPLFLVFSLLLMFSLMIGAPMLSNFFEQYAAADAFSTTIDQFPLTVLIMNNLPLLLLVSMALTAITLYGRLQ